MAGPTDHSLWLPTEDAITFEPNEINHRPRAWERALKSPVTTRHNGRKIWKRCEAPSKAQETNLGASLDYEGPLLALGDATNTLRPVKRMRLRDAHQGIIGGKENKTAQYSVTLRSEAPETPKRKQPRRKSPEPEQPGLEVGEVKIGAIESSDVVERVHQDTLRASESPALEDVRILLDSTDPMEDAVKADTVNLAREFGTAHERAVAHVDVVAGSPEVARLLIPDAIADDDPLGPSLPSKLGDETDTHVSLALSVEASLLLPREEAGSHASEASATHAEIAPVASPSPALSQIRLDISTNEASVDMPETSVTYAEPKTSPIRAVSTNKRSSPELSNYIPLTQAESSAQSPQIGTSLLRRESLRRRESPSNKRTLRKARRETLQRRDTLQEREILQKVIAETNPEHTVDEFENSVNDSSPINEVLPSDVEDPPVNAIQRASEPGPREAKANETTENDTSDVAPTIKENKIQGKDLKRALEAIEVYQSPTKSQNCKSPVDVSINEIQANRAIDAANESIARMEIDETTQILKTDRNGMDSSNKTTRSGARFSDETSMLKEFLNRAQAKKAAKVPVLTVPDVPKSQISPRRSPRKGLGSHVGTTLSPQKLRTVPNRPGTPPGKPKVEALDSDDGGEISTEITSCRRSTRTRLPAPAKGPPGAPSFIPVRRADGTDPVVLQKSQAQELAMMTRANTRRNKGQSKPPLLALQDLAAEVPEITTVSKRRAANSKTVGWAEQLASYQLTKAAVDPEEVRPKVRKVRGLGATNGTPAAKRTTAVVGISNGTPAPKRRGKVRS